ncbi:MAG: CusA/CzcA family heavy metal efflux RND transporter [Myxococcota bacterium]
MPTDHPTREVDPREERENKALFRGEDIGSLDRLIAWSLRNRLLVVVLVLLAVLFGVRAATRLPIDAVPDVTNVQVQILTDSPGLGPLEVERFVTYPVEGAMSGLPEVEEIRSLSRFGLSVVTVVFHEGTDLYWARQLVSERLSEARDGIPEGFGEPEMAPISSGLGEIFQFEVRGDGLPEADRAMVLRDVLESQIAPRLRSVPGVVEINTFGGELRTYQVEVTPERLASYDVSLDELFEALERNNTNVGGGYLVKGREQTLVRGVALYEGLEDIAAVVVDTTDEGTPITVGMLGDVVFAPMIRQGAVTRDGRGEVVTGIGMMLMGGNSRVVSLALQEAVDDLAPTLPDGVTIEVFYDRTELVDRTIGTVRWNLFEGGVLVIAVLLLTLGNLRGGLIVASAIPLSMLVAFTGMSFAGISGNLMSLGAIDFGLIVDGSVVMIENIVRVVGERRKKGLPVDETVILGAAREVASPVTFAVGIIILVYLPILGLTGIEGKMFRPMAATVVFALLGSLVFALVLMPVLAAVFLKGATEHETWLLRLAHAAYRPVLAFGMRRRWLVTSVAVAGFLCSGVTGSFLGAEFVPKLDEGAVAIQIVRPPSVSLEESIVQAGAVERSLRARFPAELRTVVSKTGRAEIATDPMGVDFSDLIVMLTPPADWVEAHDKESLVAAMEAGLRADVPGVNFAFSQPIELRTNELIEGVRSDVALILYGDDLDVLKTTGDALAGVLSGVEGAADVKVEQVAGLPMLRVDVDRAAIARLGLNAADVTDAIEALGGRPVTQVVKGRQRFVVQVRFAPQVRESEARVGAILVARPGGGSVPLDQVADVTIEEGPLQVSHESGQRRLTIEANVRGRDVASFVADAQAAITAADVVPKGYVLDWGGQFENLAEASARLAVLVPLVLVLIFVLLQANFRSVKTTLLVYANVPLAVTGGVFALALRGLPFSISAAVGFVALFGIAVMNGVVLVSQIRKLQEEGMSAEGAAREGAELRLRPVLMTALVAGLGFLPMALGHGAGAEVQRPLATVVIGGLLTSTVLTLVVLPSLYAWWMDGPLRPRKEAT